MNEWMLRLLDVKRARRQQLRRLSFSEKVKLLEKLRERSLAIARSPLRLRSSRHQHTPSA